MNESDAARSLDDRLDRLVSEFSDELNAGRKPSRREYLDRVPAAARPGFERVLKMIEAGSAQPPSATAPLLPGVELDHYRLEREVGRGGMSVVWLARDQRLQRPVALKVLRPGLALEQRHVDRFKREALAIAKLRHPHIVEIHGVGETRGYHWLAMEYVEGPSFATVLEALPTERTRTAEDLARAAGIPHLAGPHQSFEQAIARLLAPVAEALSVAHATGLVHRDVKPSNILIHSDGRAVIADFGLAKGEDDPALSLTGEGLGTPYYMSPEQAYLTGKTVDHRTDVYSLGVTIYEALAGRRPFVGDSFLEVIESIRNTIPTALPSREATRDAMALVRRAMARDPDARYATAAALHEDLVALAEGRTTEARQAEGGLLRRTLAGVRRAFSSEPFEYRSARRLLGVPLVHWISGARPAGSPRRVAKGWIACGETAYGLVAFGGVACGGFCWGGVTAGFAAFGGVAAGVFTFGGIALGLLTICGIGAGWFASGGIVVGYAAMGGIPIGKYAVGGMPIGTHVLGDARQDPEAERFFGDLLESWTAFWGMLFG